MLNKKLFKGPLLLLTMLFGFILLLSIGAIALGYSSYTTDGLKGDGTPEFSVQEDSYFAPTAMFEGGESLEYRGADLDMIASSELEGRSLIKRGDISIAVDDIDATLDEIGRVESKYDAMKISLNDYGKGIDRNVYLTIKVAEDEFESLYEELKDIEGEYQSSSIDVSDVTETMTDLQARLKNYRSVESQYLKILESAENVEETLAVYKELNQVRLDIERVETQLKNLENQTEYSYISFTISQSTVGSEIEDEGWKPAGVFKEAVRALVSFSKSIGNLLIWVVVFSPVVVLVVLPIVLLKKKAKK